MKFRASLLFVVAVCSTISLRADDWPQWRGPNRDGISREKGLLQSWPSEGPKLNWQRTDIGEGYSTPAVAGPRLYLLSNAGLDNEFVQALNVADGQQVWSTTIGKVGNPEQRPPYPGARSTPTIDGEYLYALGSDGDLACLELATGKIVWKKNVRSEFTGQYGEWAYSESPLVDGKLVVCTPGGAEATIVALDKSNGDVVWKSAIPGGDAAGYASIIVVQAHGVKQYVQFLANGLVGINAADGKFLWRYERTAKGSPANIPTPVASQGYVYSAASRSGGGLVKLTDEGGKLAAEQVYFNIKLPSSIGGSVLVDDVLYGTSSRLLMCIDFVTGETRWEDKSVAPGALMYADGNLYMHSEANEVALIEATPQAYRERGRFALPNPPETGKSRAWCYPVVANGRLYLRDWTSLWSYDVRK
jgi:outer membrane protein assembly factor BamB